GGRGLEEIFLSGGDEMILADVDALLADLDADPAARPGRYGCAGYCIGARAVLRSMAAHPDLFAAGACFHPSFCTTPGDDSPHLSRPGLPAVVYVGIGAQDLAQPVAAN